MKYNLNDGWKLLWRDLAATEIAEVMEAADFREAGSLPCDAHMPLIEQGVIRDPVEADYSYDCEWMERKSWWFRKEFTVTQEQLACREARLILESLDLFADVYLNSRHIGRHESCHYPFTAAVQDALREGENTLVVRLTAGAERISKGQMDYLADYICTEYDVDRGDRGEKARAFLRKPQYAYGWDWGPRVATMGIMKNAWLDFLGDLTFTDLHPVTLRTGPSADMRFTVEFESLPLLSTQEVTVELAVQDETGTEVLCLKQEVLAQSGANYLDFEATIPEAHLWWPNGAGAQPLYTAAVTLKSAGDTVKAPPVRFGIRTITLNTQPDEGGHRFALTVNGVDLYCKGGNWIPADSLYARVTPEKYRTLVEEAKACNFNMLRIWGGGLYERDEFYDACDEKGILLWHDFMFACALYPDDQEWFRQLAQKELHYQTRRLRRHACLALWCGNNENQWLFEDHFGDNGEKHMPSGGLWLYNQLMPAVVRANCPEVPYWRSSPYGGALPGSSDAGDTHHWRECTMHDDMEKRITPEEYDKVTSRFVSEYGYIGPCSEETIEKYYGGQPVQQGDTIWNLHNNTFEKATVPEGIRKHYTDPESLVLADYLQYARLVQGLMYQYSMEAIRFHPHNDGCLFWMYNDTWGEVGWTIIDYYLDRKPSYYYVKRAYAPLHLILRKDDNDTVQVMGVNDTAEALTTQLEYGYVGFDGQYDTKTLSVTLPAFSKGIVHRFALPQHDLQKGLIFARSAELSAALLRTGPFRAYAPAKSTVTVEDVQTQGKDLLVTLKSSGYSHAVSLDLPASVHLDDAWFDLLPGERRTLRVLDGAGTLVPADIKPIYLAPGGSAQP